MFVYVGKTYTATSVGAQLKAVHCEKCKAEFFYEVRRLSTGSGHAPYMLGQDSAKNSAVAKAQSNLERSLASAEDPVPCPACYWVNQSAIRKYRRARHNGWYWLAGLSAFFAALINAFLYFDARATLNHLPDIWAKEIWYVNLFFGPIIVGGLLLQTFLKRRFDPNNQLVNGYPALPPGIPPAIVKNQAGELIVTQRPDADASRHPEWAVVRPGQFALAPVCCLCLDSSVVPYKLPIVAVQTVSVPVCRPCLRKIRKRYWLQLFASALVSFLLGWIFSRMPQGIDLFGRTIILLFFGGFLTGIAVVIIAILLKPYTMRVVDKAGFIIKIKFQNPAYTALLIRHIAESEGTATQS